MYLHMDGARIANAAVSLQLPFRAFTKDCGVDILSFGGTKNGMMMGESVLFFNPWAGKKLKIHQETKHAAILKNEVCWRPVFSLPRKWALENKC